MAADLQAVAVVPQVVGVVDRPGGEPEELVFQRVEESETIFGDFGRGSDSEVHGSLGRGLSRV